MPMLTLHRETLSPRRLLSRLVFVLNVLTIVGLGLPFKISLDMPGPSNADPDARASAIVKQMTLDEKILELHGVGGSSPNIRTTANQLTIPVISGHSYLIEPISNHTTSLPFAPVTDQPASVAKSLGSRKIGL